MVKKSMKKFIFLFLSLLFFIELKGQDHQHHHGGPPTDTFVLNKAESFQDTVPLKDHSMSHLGESNSTFMPHAFSRNLTMSRTGSGTPLHPDNSLIFIKMFHKRKRIVVAQ